jgi:hypothetical protein
MTGWQPVSPRSAVTLPADGIWRTIEIGPTGSATIQQWQDENGVWHHPECFACRPEGCCCDLDCAASRSDDA